VRHQREVGVGYFDAVATAAGGGQSSTTALAHSTEAAQFVAPEACGGNNDDHGALAKPRQPAPAK
jgi:hypothetical protein